MNGPIAPKDPTEKRPGFYILLDKEVGGIPQDDGTGRHPIYLGDSRLTTFARVVGGVQDEGILDLLTTAEGFRRLVHSIGVSIAAPDRAMRVGFALEFRGADGDGSGSSHPFELAADGQEQAIVLDALDWTGGEVAPAALLFTFPRAEDMASATVKLYVNDGYQVPEHDPDPPVEFGTPLYREMIARSLLSSGSNCRVKRFLDRARAGEDVTIAFLGGSITQGAGAVPQQERCYARRTYEGLRERFGNNVHYIKAGVGGTPSELGLLRYARDITRDGAVHPDLVVVEFAVNDEGDETAGVFYESLVRRILSEPWEPAVIMLFSVFANDWNLRPRLSPIGYRNEVPMADVLEAVSPQFSLKPGEGRAIAKRQYFYDVYHPSNAGHQIMADCLLYLLDRLDMQQPDRPDGRYIPSYYGDGFAPLRLLDRKDGAEGAVVEPGSFTGTDEDLQRVPLDFDTVNTPMFPYNWSKEEGDAPFVLELLCSKLVLEFKDSGDPRFGKARVKIDGRWSRLLDPRDAGWTHCNTTILIDRQESALHRVEISMDPSEADRRFTILGFGYVP